MSKSGLVMAEAHCIKCRAKREIKGPKNIILKNEKPAIQGACPACRTKVFRIRG